MESFKVFKYLLVLNVFFFIQKAQSSDFSCYIHKGHCLDSCPSGFIPIEDKCEYFEQYLINLEFNQGESKDLKTQQKSEEHSLLPSTSKIIKTSLRGLFFTKNSRVEINKKITLPAIFSIQLWLLLINPGKIFEDSNRNTQMIANNSDFSAFYRSRALGFKWENSWVNLILTFRFFPENKFWMTFYSNSYMEKDFFEEKYQKTETFFILGSIENKSFSGFLYKFLVLNSLEAIMERINLPLCEIKLEEKCEILSETEVTTVEQVENCCLQNTSRLRETPYCIYEAGYTCRVNSYTSPNGVEYLSTQYDTGDAKWNSSNFFDIGFPFWKRFSDDYFYSSTYYPSLTPNEPIKGSPSRGLYFGSSNSQFLTGQLHPFYRCFLHFWIWNSAVGNMGRYYLFDRPSLFSIQAYPSMEKFYLFHSTGYSEFSLKLEYSKWSSIYFGFEFSNISSPSAEVSLKVNSQYLSTIISGFIYTIPSTITYIGGNSTNGDRFKGWMYLLLYGVLDIPGYTSGYFSNDCYKGSIYGGNLCLPICAQGEYVNSDGTCGTCPAECTNCINNQQCNTMTSCYDPDCTYCPEYRACMTCTHYEFKRQCFPECPFMTIVDPSYSKRCLQRTETLLFNMTEQGMTSSPIDLTFIREKGPKPVYLTNRGHYFSNSTILRSSEEFYFPIDHNFMIIISVKGPSNVFVGVPGYFCFNSSYNPSRPWQSLVINYNYWEGLKYANSSGSKVLTISPVMLYFMRTKINGYADKQEVVIRNDTKMSDRSKQKFEIITGVDSSAIIYIMSFSYLYIEYDGDIHRIIQISRDYPWSCTSDKYFDVSSSSCINCLSYCSSCTNGTTCASFNIMKLYNLSFPQCPTFYEIDDGKCIEGIEMTFRFKLESLKGRINDERTTSYMTLDTVSKIDWPAYSSSDPIPGKDRGMYFGYSLTTTMRSSNTLNISPELFLGFWLSPKSGYFLYKNLIELGINGQTFCINFRNLTGSFSFSASQPVVLEIWNFLAVSISFVPNDTYIDIYVNQVKENFYIGPYALVDQTGDLLVGTGLDSAQGFKGWIYEIKYSAIHVSESIIIQNLGTCSGCNCPSSTQKCLGACPPLMYFAFNECKLCPSSKACNGPSSMCFSYKCSKCVDYSSCQTCSVSTCPSTCHLSCSSCLADSPFSCMSCANGRVRLGDLCLSECPSLHLLSNSFCTADPFKLRYNFYTLGSTVSDSNNILTFQKADALTGYLRGWYIQTITQNQDFQLSPFFGLTFWIRPYSYSTVFQKSLNGNSQVKIWLTAGNLNIQLEGTTGQYTNQIAFSYTITWLFIGMSFELSSGSTEVKVYNNAAFVGNAIIQADFLSNTKEAHMTLGDTLNRMWIYSFIIHSLLTTDDISSEMLPGSCFKPTSLASCLWDSSANQFNDGSSYVACDPTCTACRVVLSCSMCRDPFCLICNDMEVSSCSQCFDTFEYDGTSCVCPAGTMRKKTVCVSCHHQCDHCTETDAYSCTQCKSTAFSFIGLCLPLCPVLTVSGVGSCTQSSTTSIIFNFYTFGDKVSDQSGNFHLDNSLNPGKFSYRRGKYFGLLYSDETLAFSPFFTLELFYRLSSYGFIFKTKEINGLSVSVNNLNVMLLSFYNTSLGTTSMTLAPSFAYGHWTYMALILEKSGNSVLVKFYKDSYQSPTSMTFSNTYFHVTSNSNFILGDSSTSMWIYKLAYFSYSRTESSLQSELGSCSGCSCPSSFGSCLELCSNNQYSSSCLPCLSNCTSCRYNDSCNYCVDRLCKTCSDTLISSCLVCTDNAELTAGNTCTCMEGFYQNNSICMSCYSLCSVCDNTDPWSCSACKSGRFRYIGLCFENCPVLTTAGSGVCTSQTQTSINFFFHIFEDEVLDDLNQFSFKHIVNRPVFGFNRGKMINQLESLQDITFGPFFSVVLWMKPLGFGKVFGKFLDFLVVLQGSQELKLEFNTTTRQLQSLTLNNGFSQNSWKFMVLTFDQSAKASPLKYYENSQSVKSSYSILNDYLSTSLSKVVIGDEISLSWIYQFKFYSVVLSSAQISSMLGTCSGCFCPAELNKCLWECDALHYFQSSCEPCLQSCESCKFNDTCSQCSNSLCSTCQSPNFLSCLTCTEHAHLTSSDCFCDSHYFRRNSFCLECNFYCKECFGEFYTNCSSCNVSINGFCTDKCPALFSLSGDKCIQSQSTAIVFTFNSLKGIQSSAGLDFQFSSASGSSYPNHTAGDPVRSYKRGLFFDNSPLATLSDFKFSMNFTVLAWVNIYNFGCLINKTRFSLSLMQVAVVVSINYQDNLASSFQSSKPLEAKKWTFVAFGIVTNAKVEASLYLNSNVNHFNDNNKYFVDVNEKLTLVNQDSLFKGWVYNLVYSSSKFEPNMIYFSDWYKVDLWPCDLNFYFEGVCKPCNACNCRRRADCTLCNDPLCEVCSDYVSDCIKCFSYAGFKPGTQICTLCSPRCLTCVYSVDTCPTCKPEYLMNHDNTCVNYCSEGDDQELGKCKKNQKKLLSFRFNKASNEFTSNNHTLYMGKEDQFWPSYDDLDPWILPMRGLYFKRSMTFLGSYSNTSQLLLANSQSFDIFLLVLEGSGIILTLNNETHPFIILSAEQVASSFNLVVNYKMTDFFASSFYNVSKIMSYATWIHLTWTLEFASTLSTLNVFFNQPASLFKTFSYQVFDQPNYSTLTLGGFEKKNFFKGYIYSLSIYNYKLTSWTLSTNSCKCSLCSAEGDCLINCGPDSYFESSCKKCLSECSLGCSNGENCLLHKDKYCKEFESMTEDCTVCINNTVQGKRPCQCITNGFYDPKKDSCVCPEGQLIYQEACDSCIRWLQPGEVKAEFAENFLEVSFRFNVSLAQVACEDLFFENDLKKFGKDFICAFSDEFDFLNIQFGKGYYLKNETIRLNSQKLRGNFQQCGFKQVALSTQINYTADLPVPEAIIQAPETVFMKCQDLEVDGILSTGQLLDGLLYEWSFTGALSKFNKDFSLMSGLKIEKRLLVKGEYSVTLTVKNKFDQLSSNSSNFEVIDIDTLAAIFDPLIDYSCPESQSCTFAIQEIQSCIPNASIEITWEFTQGSQQLTPANLKLFWSNQTVPSALQIPKKMFRPSWLTFTLKLFETTKKVMISKMLKIKIKSEAPDIAFDRTPGSVSSLDDLIINATLPVRPSTIIVYQWSCIYKEKPCTFEFDDVNAVLFIPVSITSQKIIDKLSLAVTTTQTIGRMLQENETLSSSLNFSCKFVDWIVPVVKITQIGTGKQPKVFSSTKVTMLRADIVGEGSYSVIWSLGNFSVFASGNTSIDVGINSWLLTKGSSYKLKLEVKDGKKHASDFEYDFTVNSPPKLGIFTVSPDEGIELETEFNLAASDWVDAEENYPLFYSFGVYSKGKATKIMTKTQSSYYRKVKFPYFDPVVILFAQVFDSLDDFSEITTNVSLQINENLNIEAFMGNLNSGLGSALIPNLPVELTNQISTIFNRDENVLGSFLEPSNSTLDNQLKAYEIIGSYLELFINSTSSSTIETSVQILSLMNRNPFITSDTSFNTTMKITEAIFSSMDPSQGLSESICENLHESISSTFYFESAENSSRQLSRYEDFQKNLSLGMSKNLLPGQSVSFLSSKVSLDIQKIYVPKQDFSISSTSSEDAGSKIPLEFFQSIKSQSLTVSLSLTKTSPSSNVSIVAVSLFDETSEIEALVKESSFEVVIPYKNATSLKNPVCVFLNSSQLWNDSGCEVKEVSLNSITCSCNHLTSFSTGDLEGGFFPSNNIEQTVDFESLKNLSATSAIGFYFAGAVLVVYLFIGSTSLKKDKSDLLELRLKFEDKNAKPFVAVSNDSEEVDPAEIAVNADILNPPDEQRPQSDKEFVKEAFREMIQHHKFLTVYNLYDPLRSRFNRASLLFFNVIGKMYFIGLFYEGEKTPTNDAKGMLASYTLRDFLVILWSNLIILAANAFFLYLMKMKPVLPNMPREVFETNVKYNSRKNLCIFILFVTIFVYLLWSIAMFAMNLDQFTSYKWIINTSVSIFIDMLITPFIKGVLITVIGGWIIKKLKERTERKKIYSSTVVPIEGEINVHSDEKR